MGFTTGFTGGVTLTLGVAYLTVLAHERNRQAHAQSLRSQARVLGGLLEPTPLPPPQTRAELAREERSTLTETAKDRWNAEIENAVRWVQKADWDEVREGMEGAVARLLGTGLAKSREGIEEAEKIAGPKVQEAVDRSKAAARKGADHVAVGIDQAAAATVSGAEKAAEVTKEQLRYAGAQSAEYGDAAQAKAGQAVDATKDQLRHAVAKSVEYGDAAKAKSDRVVANAKSGAQDAAESVRQSRGTVDAARSAVRDAVSKGIEKGKQVLGQAQEAVGLATEKFGSKAQAAGLTHSSAVEKALHERFGKSNELSKSQEEALAERYVPIDARDNSHLRGL